MWQWLSSYVAVTVAVFIILASVVAFFTIQQNAIRDTEFSQIARKIADVIDSVSTVNGNTTKNLTFETYQGGVQIPKVFYGEIYFINITKNSVFLSQKSRAAHINFRVNVHPWNPVLLNDSAHNYYTDPSELAYRDSLQPFLAFYSNTTYTVVIERKEISVNYDIQYHTFVYLK
ncbi:MAG: hypothetical protein QW115_00270 [Thermoplasmata archaeon]